ncbi:MAG: RluA family pseudouridine synthase [Acidobacteria bacterium]|nr:MAG: RluA family pseudouridine synthase [Acidobacteriota bacterium]
MGRATELTKTEWIVAADEAGARLDKFLSAPGRLGSRSRAAAAREKGKVFVNGQEVGRGGNSVRLAAGDIVRIWMDRPGSARRRPGPFRGKELDILYEDSWLLVLNKPAGLLTVPLERKRGEPSVYEQIKTHLRSHGKRRPFVVHRIDRDTSGVVLFAKDAPTQQSLKRQFLHRTPERVYRAVVYGHPTPARGTWHDHLVWDRKALIQKQTHPRDPRGTEAISDYRVIEAFEKASLIEVRLRTGKRNQIRIQARLRGHTLIGEQRYTYGPDELRPVEFARQALHAHGLGFEHPSDGRRLQFEAPMPKDMLELIAELREQEP